MLNSSLMDHKTSANSWPSSGQEDREQINSNNAAERTRHIVPNIIIHGDQRHFCY